MDPLFGSETRARVLEQLAATPLAQSAYRVARAVGAEPIQVTRILKSLEGLTEHSVDGWVLTNELLRDFLRDRLARREARVRAEKDQLLVHFGLKPSSRYGSGRVRQANRIRT